MSICCGYVFFHDRNIRIIWVPFVWWLCLVIVIMSQHDFDTTLYFRAPMMKINSLTRIHTNWRRQNKTHRCLMDTYLIVIDTSLAFIILVTKKAKIVLVESSFDTLNSHSKCFWTNDYEQMCSLRFDWHIFFRYVYTVYWYSSHKITNSSLKYLFKLYDHLVQ